MKNRWRADNGHCPTGKSPPVQANRCPASKRNIFRLAVW